MNKFWNHVVHALLGMVLVSVPIVINNIPQSWQNMTVGAALGVIWGMGSAYIRSL